MNPSVEPLKRTLDLNSRLFLNALEGIDEETARRRPNESTNHVAFVACHLVDARHHLARTLGLASESPFKEILDEAKGIDDVKEFPTLDEMRSAWQAVSRELSEHLAGLDAAALEKPAPYEFPIEDGKTTLGCLTFLIQHDTYHLGQIALLRRLLGLEPMSYR
jgi:uncharacterized damage-inducible protein DinB